MTHGKHSAPIQKSPAKIVFGSIFPTAKDNPYQLTLKIFFLVCVIAIIVVSIIGSVSLGSVATQKRIAKKSREIWYDTKKTAQEKTDLLEKQNGDFKGWLTVYNSNIDLPVYQSSQKDYYKNRNQLKKKSRHGALHLDVNDNLNSSKDCNIVITGNNMSDGTMFNNLELYRKLSFYKENPTVSFWSGSGEEKYVVFAVFLIDAAYGKEDYFNPNYSDFFDEATFYDWISNATTRSIINTNVDVLFTDRLLTLVTETKDFEGSQLVVMARKLRQEESLQTSKAAINPAPKYPRAWYDEKGLKYPY